MAISDTLSDSIVGIREYQNTGMYEGLEKEIDAVVGYMRALQSYLDCPPIPGLDELQREQLREALKISNGPSGQ